MSLDADFFEKFGHVDTYISAKEAKKLGLTNHVGYPCLKLNFSLSMSIDLKVKRNEIPDPDKRHTKYRKFICDPVLITDPAEEDD